MDASYIEMARLKALRMFGNVLDKPYAEWTRDEKKACAILDEAWRKENMPEVIDPQTRLRRAMELAAPQKRGQLDLWRRDALRLAGFWDAERSGSFSFLKDFYAAICRLWDSFKERIGWKSKDSISPFEGIRILKIMDDPRFRNLADIESEILANIKTSPSLDKQEAPDQSEWRGAPPEIRARYEKRAGEIAEERQKELSGIAGNEEKWEAEKRWDAALASLKAEFASEMIAVNPLCGAAFERICENIDLSRGLYARTFLQALARPYSQWSKAEKDACSVLDALWRRERGLPLFTDGADIDHWRGLNKRLMGLGRGERAKLNAGIAKCGARAKDAKNGETSISLAYSRAMGICGRLGGEGSHSPFEIIRMLLIMDDPKVGIDSAVSEIQGYALGFADASPARFSSGIVPRKGEEDVFGGREYMLFESEAFAKLVDKKGESFENEPVEIRFSGIMGNVCVRCLDKEPEAVADAFLMSVGHGQVTMRQCRGIALGLLQSLQNGDGAYDTYISSGGADIAFASGFLGISKLFGAEAKTEDPPAAVNLEKEAVTAAPEEQIADDGGEYGEEDKDVVYDDSGFDEALAPSDW